MAATRPLNFTMTGGETPERTHGIVVSANYFSMLGVTPVLGRDFSAAEDQPGAARVALLMYGFWKSRFGGDPGVIGRTLMLNGSSVTVAGVLPAGFVSEQTDFYVNPLYGVPELFAGTGDPRNRPFPHYLNIIGRLKPGVTRAQAQQDLGGIIAKLGAAQPASKGARSSSGVAG